MLGMLIAYNAGGEVVGTLDYLVQYDADKSPLGLVDFAIHEEKGGEHTDIWRVEGTSPAPLSALSELCPGGAVHGAGAMIPGGVAPLCPGGEYRTPAKGSKVWPEWLGAKAHNFRVELEGPPGRKRIAALVHKVSGHRRERAGIEAAIADRIEKANGEPADIRDLVGGPDRPLVLDDAGRNVDRPARAPLVPFVNKRVFID